MRLRVTKNPNLSLAANVFNPFVFHNTGVSMVAKPVPHLVFPGCHQSCCRKHLQNLERSLPEGAMSGL